MCKINVFNLCLPMWCPYLTNMSQDCLSTLWPFTFVSLGYEQPHVHLDPASFIPLLYIIYIYICKLRLLINIYKHAWEYYSWMIILFVDHWYSTMKTPYSISYHLIFGYAYFLVFISLVLVRLIKIPPLYLCDVTVLLSLWWIERLTCISFP